MARKFKDDLPTGETSLTLSSTLFDYVSQFAPDVLDALPCMKSRLPLEYWQALFEKEKHIESKKPGKNNGLEWDYAKRLVYLARKFKSFSDKHQNEIIGARKEKIFWRGDEPDFFNTVITETILFRDLEPVEKENYKKRLMVVSKSLGARHAMF